MIPSSPFNNQSPVGVKLSQYTAAITDTVASARHLAGQWVIAELSDVRISGGHCYMELIEKNEAGQTIAKLRATIWRSSYYQLREKFYSATQREISNGIKALVRGSATHHSVFGLSFNIIDIDPSYTIGDLDRLRREILMKLQKEGIVDLNKRLELPAAPQKIAVISAEGAAGYGDFINHLCGNSEGFVFYPGLFPCVMQGDRVSESIRKALQIIEATADMWDCIAIVRGGGATTDLNGFDDYELAKAIATCGLPVVVGIGHERDRNVLDEIAHTSLKTPTAVAGFFIDRAREAYDYILSIADKIRLYSSDLMLGEERHLSTIQGLIPQLSMRRLEEAKAYVNNLAGKIPILTQGRLEKENIRLNGMADILSANLQNIFRKEEVTINSYINLLSNLTSNNIEKANHKISTAEALIRVLDPRNTLKRGYSITRINGKAFHLSTNVSTGDIIETTLYDGEIKSQVL